MKKCSRCEVRCCLLQTISRVVKITHPYSRECWRGVKAPEAICWSLAPFSAHISLNRFPRPPMNENSIRPPYAPITLQLHDQKSIQLHESSLKLLSPIVNLITKLSLHIFNFFLRIPNQISKYRTNHKERKKLTKCQKNRKVWIQREVVLWSSKKRHGQKKKEKTEAALIVRSFELHDESARGTVRCASVRACRVVARERWAERGTRDRLRETPRCARNRQTERRASRKGGIRNGVLAAHDPRRSARGRRLNLPTCAHLYIYTYIHVSLR